LALAANAQNMTPNTTQISFNPNGPLAPGQSAAVIITWTANVDGVKLTPGGPLASSVPISVQGSASGNTFDISSGEANSNNNMFVGQRVTFSDGSNQVVTSFVANVSISFAAPVPVSATSASWIGSEYASEEDDVTMVNGCPSGGLAAGNQCTTQVSLLADTDDKQCDLNWPTVAYPGIGCQGLVNFRISNPAKPGTYTVFSIPYTYVYYNPNPEVSISPSALAFPATPVGTQASTMSFDIMNVDDAPLSITSITATGAAYSQTNDCPAQLTSLQTCDVTVTFAPTKTGPNEGSIGIVDNASNQKVKKVTLTGTGTK
jgi:hypothetical protein